MRAQRRVRIGLAFLAAALGLPGSGCVSVDATLSPPTSEAAASASVNVTIFDTRAARDSGVPTGRRVVAELWRLGGGKRELVRSVVGALWSQDGLPPARYEVRVEHELGEDGTPRRLRSRDHARFTLAAGQSAEVTVVLRHPRRALVGGSVATGVVIVVGVTVLIVEIVMALTAL